MSGYVSGHILTKGRAPFQSKALLYYPFTSNGLAYKLDGYGTAGRQALLAILKLQADDFFFPFNLLAELGFCGQI